MAINIPMPDSPGTGFLKGIDTGSSMFTRMIQPKIEREKQAQLERHFQEQLKLSKAAAARAGANSDLRRALLEQQILAAQHANDPNYEFNQFKNLMGMMGGGNTGGGQMPQAPMPTQEMGEGMGMFTPEGLGQMQQEAPQTAPDNGMGFNFDALKQNPMLRGFFKKKFGFDPLAQAAQTPEEKQAAALDLFKQKEAIKAQSKGGSAPTNAVLTQTQQAIQGIDTVLPMLDELITSKNVPGIFDFSPGKKAAYNAKTSSMIDTLVAAQSLPKVQASIDLVEEQIRRKSGETVKDYQTRLKDLKNDLMKRRQRAQGVLQTRQINTNAPEDYSHMSDEELQKIAGGG
jgi:hypothetical protein